MNDPIHLTRGIAGKIACGLDLGYVRPASTLRGELVTCPACLKKMEAVRRRNAKTSDVFSGSPSKRAHLRQHYLARFMPWRSDKHQVVVNGEPRVHPLTIRHGASMDQPLMDARFRTYCGVAWLRTKAPELYAVCVSGLLNGDLQGDEQNWVTEF